MSDEVKIGMIGVGQIGKRHVAAYQEIDGARIVAVADTDEAEARRVADEVGAEHVFTDLRELLAMDQIDSVDVCLHNNMHMPATVAALEAGKNVYCEKPMAGAYVDARKMLDTARACGRKLSIQLSTLFTPETHAAERLIADGRLGKLYYAKSSYYRRRGRPYVDGYGTDRFVQKKTAGGGALYDMGVYHIAQVLYLLGNPDIITISGATHQEIDMYADRGAVYDVEELGVGFVRLAGGITFFIEESWAIHMGSADGSELMGAKGGVSLAPFAYFTTICDTEMDATADLKSAEWRRGQCVPDTDAYTGAQQHWIAAQQGRVELMPTAETALSTMLISEGIYLSQRLGREVTADEVLANSASTAIDI